MMFDSTTAKRGRQAVARLAVSSVIVLAAATAAFSVSAQGRHGHGMEGGGGHGMMMFGGSPERIGRAVDRMLDGLDATEAQRSQIKQIAATAAVDLKAQREAGRGLRDQGMQILASPNIDAVAAETLRRQLLAQHDLSSKRVMQAMLEVANVLTPDQRAKISERVKERRAKFLERRQR